MSRRLLFYMPWIEHANWQTLHVIAVKDIYRIRDERAKIWIEEVMSDHAFAESFKIFHMPGSAGKFYKSEGQ